MTAPSSRIISHVLPETYREVIHHELYYGTESRPTSKFCPALRSLMIIPSCRECSKLRNDLDKNDDIAFIGQSDGTIERI